MRQCRLTSEYGSVFYWVSEDWVPGRGTLFFFPGLTADHSMFEGQLAHFKGRFNLLTWDAPCHGLSRPYEVFSFAHTTELILRILAETGTGRIVAVGQSLGGYYAQALMARRPEKVAAFIGIGTTPYGEGYYSRSDIFWLRQVERLGLCCPAGPLKKAAARNAAVTKAGYENMMAMTAPYSRREYCRLMQRAYDAFLADNRPLSIPCPVLISHGEHDRTGKVRQYCRMWHQRTAYPLAIVKNAGHIANVDAPAEMNRLMDEFLAANL